MIVTLILRHLFHQHQTIRIDGLADMAFLQGAFLQFADGNVIQIDAEAVTTPVFDVGRA